jgi:endonuclease YncB( thermonuclease family)
MRRMRGVSHLLQIAGIVFGLVLLVGIIGTFMSEVKVFEVKENLSGNISKEIVLKPCDFYGCEKEGNKRCSSESMFGDVEICKVDEEEKCLRWTEYEKCRKGCRNATCIEKLPPEPCWYNGCNKSGEKKCIFDSVYVCKLDEVSWCLRWEVNESCSYGCENGRCIERKGTTITTLSTKYFVARVIDGDTFVLNTGEKVRLILINAPEIGEKCYDESKKRLEELVLNKEVRLEKDVSETDKYGRLLRYVYVDSIFVNYQLVREGYAYAYPYPPDIRYESLIEEAEKLARQEGKGCLWRKGETTTTVTSVTTSTITSTTTSTTIVSPTPENCIYISYFHYDAGGDDRYNLNDEYVIFKNRCNVSFDMTNWKIKDEANHTYTFPKFTFNLLASFTLYTGSGTDTSDKLYWNSDIPIWNNDHDTLYLYDATGHLILKYSY